MKKSIKYKGAYTDSSGSVPIEILNDFEALFVEIDGIPFSGRDFSDFSVTEGREYLLEKTDRFSFLHRMLSGGDSVKTLSGGIFKMIIPQVIIDQKFQVSIVVDLELECELRIVDNSYVSEFFRITLSINGNLYAGSGDLIEGVFDQLKSQFDGLYSLKNCYGCMYGDYSVYGQANFGRMLCFTNQKDAYKSVSNKDEYMELDTDVFVQEIYCCDEFEPRIKGAGYRG